ncbi:hypothetical protein [Chlorogloea sp. CCALA 695]|uniref:hypothetical protein n=1 Tax=Chlorogloea sp. CCALA 695 TaxID=2107693 RepID=UPI001E5630FE|nr:hypothetical protein [Chlorogloea sp. CCALA 695]
MKSLLVGEAKLKISSNDIYKMGDFCLNAQNLYTYIYLIHPTNTGRKQLLYTKIDNTTTPL